jgi:hypothetical protein
MGGRSQNVRRATKALSAGGYCLCEASHVVWYVYAGVGGDGVMG